MKILQIRWKIKFSVAVFALLKIKDKEQMWRAGKKRHLKHKRKIIQLTVYFLETDTQKSEALSNKVLKEKSPVNPKLYIQWK